MDFTETVSRSAAIARQLKSEAANRRGATELPSVIEVYREGEAALVLNYRSDTVVHTDVMEQAAQLFCPDLMVFAADAWLAARMTNPLTGREWHPGELSRVVAENDALAKGWVVEAVMVLAAARNGETEALAAPYRATGSGVEWLDPTELPDVAVHVYRQQADQMFGMLVDNPPQQFSGGAEAERARADLDGIAKLSQWMSQASGNPSVRSSPRKWCSGAFSLMVVFRR